MLCVPNRYVVEKDVKMNPNSLINNEFDALSSTKEKEAISPFIAAFQADYKTTTDDRKFPIESFPPPLQEIISQHQKCLLFPISYTGTAILFASSVAIGNTHWVRIKKGFQVPVVLYCALVGKVGVAKSHPLKFAIKPLVQKDSEAAKKYAASIKAFSAYEKMSQAEKKKADKVNSPVLKKFLMQDFTPESLQNCHSSNLRGLGAYQDELMAWVNNFNRYAKGSAEQFWLSNHSGTFTDNHRTEKYTRIDYSFVSVMGTIQPELLKAFGLDRIYNGFLDRILFDYPVNLQKEYWTEEELPDEIFTIYDDIICKLVSLPFTGEPSYISFEARAKKKLFEWQRHNTDIANSKKNYESGICSKYDTILPRISLILQMLHDICDGKKTVQIDLSNVEKAIDLIEYYRESARRVYAEILNDDSTTKKTEQVQRKQRAIELYQEGKSLREIARIVLGNENKFSTIAHWIK